MSSHIIVSFTQTILQNIKSSYLHINHINCGFLYFVILYYYYYYYYYSIFNTIRRPLEKAMLFLSILLFKWYIYLYFQYCAIFNTNQLQDNYYPFIVHYAVVFDSSMCSCHQSYYIVSTIKCFII